MFGSDKKKNGTKGSCMQGSRGCGRARDVLRCFASSLLNRETVKADYAEN